MPEGVEVKISADLIKPIMFGRKICNAAATRNSRYNSKEPKGLKEFKHDLYRGCQVVDIQAKGKFMYWTFSNDWYLMNTFGMTGQWSQTKGQHPCFFFEFWTEDYVDMMYFNDPRHFGTIQFTNSFHELQKKLDSLGWDPLNREFMDMASFVLSRMTQSKKPIGELLMNQEVFAGVGNYIRAEALYESKISPWRISHDLKLDEKTSLCQALVKVMKESYAHQGATIHTYKNSYGEEGKYSSCFKVYGQEKDPFGNPIKRETTPEGRTIHWCPAVQK